MTPEETIAFERWRSKRGASFWLSDELREQIIADNEIKLCSSEALLKRLNEAKSEAERLQSIKPVEKLFLGLVQHQEGGSWGEVAKAEAEALRVYKLWFRYFDDWYLKFWSKITNECSIQCPERCPHHKQLELFNQGEVAESDYAF